jgi:outer membrane protein assembly factor BamB
MTYTLACLVLMCAMSASPGTNAGADQYWPQWRGPLGTGVAPHADPPLHWSETRNIRWKIEVPGSGHATPIVWQQYIYLTTAIPVGEPVKPKPEVAPGAHDNTPVSRHYRFVVLAIRRSDGSIAWQRTVNEALPHERSHNTASFASGSAVTDGQYVFAYFGSRGLYCLDLDGHLLWQKDLGDMQIKHAHGEGSSPVLYGDTLIVNRDHEGQSMLVAFNKHNGDELWKVERDEVTSWSSPIVVEHQGQAQVIVSGSKRVRGYELATGEVIWECGGLSHNIVASPVAADGIVFAGSSYGHQAMLAIRLDGAKGDITGSEQVLWTRRRHTPYVPSPLLYGNALYYHSHYQGILSRVDTKTGECPLGPFRLGGIRNVYASPIGAADRIYICDRQGTTVVISHEAKPRILAQNRLDDHFSASPAAVGRELYLRGDRYLYCIVDE